MVYIKLFLDYLDAIEPLDDAERGRLFTALLEYARTGEAPQLGGNERFIFPMMKANIDRDAVAKAELAEKRAVAGAKGGNQKQANLAKASKCHQEKEKEEEKDKEKDKEEIESAPAFENAALQSAFENWLAYKKERREAYRQQGLKALITEIGNNAERYGAETVASLIRECMSNGYKGIIFDRLERKKPAMNQTAKGFSKDEEKKALENLRKMYNATQSRKQETEIK